MNRFSTRHSFIIYSKFAGHWILRVLHDLRRVWNVTRQVTYFWVVLYFISAHKHEKINLINNVNLMLCIWFHDQPKKHILAFLNDITVNLRHAGPEIAKLKRTF